MITLVLARQCCRKNAKLGCHNGAAKNAPSWCCQKSAAKLAASMVIAAKLAASMAVQAILGAFPAALGSMSMHVGLLALLCRNLAVAIEFAYQQLSANLQAVVLLQGFSLLSASNTRNIKTTCYANSFV